MIEAFDAAVGAAAYFGVRNVLIPVGKQIADALYTNPPEQSQKR